MGQAITVPMDIATPIMDTIPPIIDHTMVIAVTMEVDVALTIAVTVLPLAPAAITVDMADIMEDMVAAGKSTSV